MYTSWVILSSTNTIEPSLLPAKQPQIICDISLSRFFPFTFFGRYFSFLFWYLHTQTVRVLLFFLIADSSDQITLTQSSAIQCWCFLAYLNRFLTCFSVNNALFTALHLLILSVWSRFCNILVDTDILQADLNSCKGSFVSFSTALVRYQSLMIEVFLDLSGQEWFSTELCSRNHFKKDSTVVWEIFNSFPISVSL